MTQYVIQKPQESLLKSPFVPQYPPPQKKKVSKESMGSYLVLRVLLMSLTLSFVGSRVGPEWMREYVMLE